MPGLCRRGLSSVRSWSVMVDVVLAHLLDQQEQRIVRRQQVAEPRTARAAPATAEELLGRVDWRSGSGCRGRAAPPRPAAPRSVPPASGGRGCPRPDHRQHAASKRAPHAASANAASRDMMRAAPRRSAGHRSRRSGASTAATSSSRFTLGAELGRAGQAARIPGDMLAREPHAGSAPKCAQHRVVMLQQICFCVARAGSARSLPCAQEMRDLGGEPGAAVAAAPDHHAIRAGAAQRLGRIVLGDDVAVDDHRDADRSLTPRMKSQSALPV